MLSAGFSSAGDADIPEEIFSNSSSVPALFAVSRKEYRLCIKANYAALEKHTRCKTNKYIWNVKVNQSSSFLRRIHDHSDRHRTYDLQQTIYIAIRHEQSCLKIFTHFRHSLVSAFRVIITSWQLYIANCSHHIWPLVVGNRFQGHFALEQKFKLYMSKETVKILHQQQRSTPLRTNDVSRTYV